TDNAVIEGFGHQNRSNGTFNVSGFVDHNRGVTGTYADSRLTGAVSCFHHAWTTGSEDQVDVRVMHQRVRQFNGRLVNPADQVFRRTGSDSRLQHDIRRFVGG